MAAQAEEGSIRDVACCPCLRIRKRSPYAASRKWKGRSLVDSAIKLKNYHNF
jgi:hypothetical protein